MSYDSAPPLARFSNRANIGYPLLADRRSQIIGGFNLIDTLQRKNSRWYGSATPMIVVIDGKGIVRQRFSTLDHRDRPDVDKVLDAIRGRTHS